MTNAKNINQWVVFIAVAFVLAFQPALDHWGQTWLSPWEHMLMIGAVAGGLALARVHFSLALLSLSVAASSVMGFAHVSPGMRWSLANVGTSAYTLCAFAAVVATCVMLPAKKLRAAFVCAGVAVNLVVLFKTAMGAPQDARWAWIGNPSQTGCFLACVLPLSLISRPGHAIDAVLNVIVVTMTLASLYAIGAAVPWLCLIAAISVVVVRKEPKVIPWLIGAAAGTAFVVWAFWTDIAAIEAINDSGRTNVWRIGLEHWANAPWLTKLLGFGAGSTKLALPQWFPSDGQRDLWLWYHSDIVQQLLEFGAFGLFAAGYVAYTAIRSTWHFSARYLASLAAIFVWCAANYPYRMAFPALFCSAVVIGALRRGRLTA